jgi:hypothetical protein
MVSRLILFLKLLCHHSSLTVVRFALSGCHCSVASNFPLPNFPLFIIRHSSFLSNCCPLRVVRLSLFSNSYFLLPNFPLFIIRHSSFLIMFSASRYQVVIVQKPPTSNFQTSRFPTSHFPPPNFPPPTS